MANELKLSSVYQGAIYQLKRGLFRKRWKRRYARLSIEGIFSWYKDATCKEIKGTLDLTQVANGIKFGEKAVESYKLRASEVQYTLQFLLMAIPDEILPNTIHWFHVNWEEETLDWIKAFGTVLAKQGYAPKLDQPEKKGGEGEEENENAGRVSPRDYIKNFDNQEKRNLIKLRLALNIDFSDLLNEWTKYWTEGIGQCRREKGKPHEKPT